MAFLKKNHQDIFEAMSADIRKRLPELTDFEQGSVIRSLLETIAFEQAVFYQQLDYIYNSSFVNTASGINLEKVVAILDVYRNEPDYANGKVTFYKEADLEEEIIIPIGTLVVTEDNPDQNPPRKAYQTIEEGVLSADRNSVDVKVQAQSRGREMETKKDTLIVLPRPIAGIERVTNQESINFLGRDRETDEELRLRAKKTLLAAGRASEISIEQALLAMPNILDVKVNEIEEQPGVIDVYVDGLDENNSKALSDRLEEVRAAGIYARLKPADIVNFIGIMKLVPHEDVIADEILQLEQQVLETIAKYVRTKKMGEPLSITQLTSQILGVKGVKDLARYDVTLIEEHIDPDNPPVTEESGIENPEEQPIKILVGQDAETNKIYRIPDDPKNIVISEYGRFAPKNMRVAAGDKELPIQFQVKIKYPNVDSSANIAGKVEAELNEGNFTTTDLEDPELPLTKKVIDNYVTVVNEYYTKFKEDFLIDVRALRVDPLGDKESQFLAWLKDASGLVGEQEEGTMQSFSMDEQLLKDKYFELISTKTGEEPVMKDFVKAAINELVELAVNNSINVFPEGEIAGDLILDATIDLKDQLDVIKNEVVDLNKKIANDQLVLISEKDEDKRKDLQKAIDDNLKLAKTKQAAQDKLQNKINNISAALNNLLQMWSAKAETKIRELASAANLNKFTTAISKQTDFDLSLRMRTTTFENKEYYNVPIPVSFIEKPTFDYLWIYSKDLRIVGTLKLSLPVTLPTKEKKAVYVKVREALSWVLYNQRPEADIEIAALIDAAEAQHHVLGAEFDKETLGLVEDQQKTLKLLPDRVTDKALIVNYSEKVLLSDEYFSIEG